MAMQTYRPRRCPRRKQDAEQMIHQWIHVMRRFCSSEVEEEEMMVSNWHYVTLAYVMSAMSATYPKSQQGFVGGI